jgi:hypothetical protein
MNNPFFETVLYGGYFFLAASTLVGVIRFRKLNGDQRILLTLLFNAVIVELAGRILWMNEWSNLFLYHFYAVAEFLLLSTLYSRHLNGLIKPLYIKSLMIAFLIFAVVNSLFFQSLKQFNSNVTFIEGLLLIVLSIVYFYKLLRDLDHKKLERVPMFWINMSVLTYFSGALILFHVANDLIPLPLKERGAIWGTHALFNVVHYCLYGIALRVQPERK